MCREINPSWISLHRLSSSGATGCYSMTYFPLAGAQLDKSKAYTGRKNLLASTFLGNPGSQDRAHTHTPAGRGWRKQKHPSRQIRIEMSFPQLLHHYLPVATTSFW